MLRSSRYPLVLVFNSHTDQSGPSVYRMLFKTNDDLRQVPYLTYRAYSTLLKYYNTAQDCFVMRLFQYMSDICLRDGIDLRLTFYDILPTSSDEVSALISYMSKII